MDMGQLRSFIQLENEKRDLDGRLKAIHEEIDRLEAALLPQFIGDGVQSMNVDGRTVYLAQDVYASSASGERNDVVQALKASELDQYVAENYNTNSLKAWVKEIAAEAREDCLREQRLFDEAAVMAALPAPLQSVLRVSFVHSLRSRKS